MVYEFGQPSRFNTTIIQILRLVMVQQVTIATALISRPDGCSCIFVLGVQLTF